MGVIKIPAEALMAISMNLNKSFSVFDADSHVLEPAAVWEDFLDPEYRVVARSWFWHEVDEVGPHTILNGRPAPALTTSSIPRYAIWRPGMTAQDIGGLDPHKPHPVNPGASDPQARLKDMDAMGVDQALLFPTLFAEYFPFIENPDVAYALARAYNDWVLDFSGAAPVRLFPVAVLPLQDVNFAVREVKRVAAAGFRAAMIRPVFFNDRLPHHAYYQPLWQELESHGLTACSHPTAGPAAPEMDANAPFVERVSANAKIGHPMAEVSALAMDNAAFLVAIMFEGLMEKFPKLKMAFTHSGAGWLTVALEKAETYLWLSEQADPVSLEPEHVFQNRKNLVTFDSGDATVRRMPTVFEQFGSWGSRYPNHDAASAWDAIQDLQAGGVPGSTIEKLMGGNAHDVLGVKPLLQVTSVS